MISMICMISVGEVFSTEKPKRCYMIYHIIPELLKHNNMSQKTVRLLIYAQDTICYVYILVY